MSEQKEVLFSKMNRKLLSDPMNDNNPVTVQVLGICSALAITVQLKAAIVMALSVLVVLSVANVLVSFMRKLIPSRIRIIVQLVVIALLLISYIRRKILFILSLNNIKYFIQVIILIILMLILFIFL